MIDKLKKAVENTNISYLSGEYKGVRSRQTFVCNAGHEFTRSYDSVVNAKRLKCPLCDGRFFDTKYIREVLSKEGYKLLSEYKNANTLISVECPNGHIKDVYYSNYSRGHRCLVCSDSKWTNEEIDNLLSPNNYTRVGNYTGIFDKFEVVCSKGHNINIVLNDFNKGSRCPVCQSTDIEIGFENEIKESGVKYLIRDRTVIKPYELDFYFPDFKFAVELHGSHWHSDQFKSKYDHRDKYLRCRENNITLIQIFDFEWYSRKKQIINYVNSKVGVFKESIYARDCLTISPNPNEVKDFINNNHIQGYVSHTEAYGLSYNGELVGLITLSRHHRISSQLILNRMCVKGGINIVGGIKKMFESIPMKKGLITHADLRFTTGEIYLSLGFQVKHYNKPDYVYIKNGKMKSKQSMKKTKEERLINKSESELRRDQGYYKLWDAGKICYVFP